MTTTKSATAILLLDLRPKTFLGIDLISFSSSPNFHGIVNVPPGLHCLYSGTDASLSIRHCHWLNFNSQAPASRTYVLRWDHETESLVLLEPTSTAAQAAVRGIPSLQGRGLVDYIALQDATSDLQAKHNNSAAPAKLPNVDAWSALSQHITTQTLDRILKPASQDQGGWILSSISSAPSDKEDIPGLTTEEAASVLHDSQASTINLIYINLKRTWPDNSVGRDRTEKARDRSWYLGHVIDSLTSESGTENSGKNRQTGARQLLAELQFCFLMILTLANYSCLEQWKRILGVVLTSKVALRDVEGFFVEAVEVLRAQLERFEDVDGGLFEMSDETGSAWLRGLMKTFRANVDEVIDEQDAESGLRTKLTALEQWLRETYGWTDESNVLRRGMVDLEDGERVEVQMDGLDEEEETGEYAPVVVEMEG